MASKKWTVLPGGRIKRWKRARTSKRQVVPPHWFRNSFNRRDRRLARAAILSGEEHGYPHVHPHCAGWYW